VYTFSGLTQLNRLLEEHLTHKNLSSSGTMQKENQQETETRKSQVAQKTNQYLNNVS